MTTGFVTKRERTAYPGNCLRLEPEDRLCSRFDPAGIAMFPVATLERMGFRVVDDFCQEHIM